MIETDLVIVGAGPAGLFATFYAGMRGLSVTLVDSLPHLGGQTAALYPDKLIYDIAGLPAVRGGDLIASLTEQAMSAHPVVLLGRQALTLKHEGEEAIVVSVDDDHIRAGAVLVTAGIGRFVPRPLPAVDCFGGTGIDVVVGSADRYAGEDVVVVGGGDSAVDWANMIAARAKSVTLIHRRAKLRAHESSISALRTTRTRLLVNSEITEVHGVDRLHAVTVRDCTTNSSERLDASVLIPALGHIASLGPLADWGIALQDKQIVTSTTMATNLPRVYAAGDITTYPGKVKLIAVGFGEAATAVNNIASVLCPGADVFPGHSTDRPPQ